MWTYKDKPIKTLQDMQKICPKVWGFVYEIRLYDKKTGKFVHDYIGKKNVYSVTNKPITKTTYSELLKRGDKVSRQKSKKGVTTYKKQIIRESEWKNYYSSCKFIKENKNDFILEREILLFCTNDTELKYQEAKHILCSGALEGDVSLNNGISLRMFNRLIIE